jgi:hypothetical protein
VRSALKSRHRASLLRSCQPLPHGLCLKQRAMTTMRARQDAREPGALRRPGVSTRRTNNGSEHEGKPTSAAGAAASVTDLIRRGRAPRFLIECYACAAQDLCSSVKDLRCAGAEPRR